MPALFTSTCRSPNSSSACWTSRRAPSNVEMSSWLATATPPAALISSTTDCAGRTSAPLPSAEPPTSLTTTRAPSRASSNACARPSPRPAPVTIAVRPRRVPVPAHRSAMVDRLTVRGDPAGQGAPERPQLVARRAQGHLDVFAEPVVAVQLVVEIDAHPAVQVVCRVQHAMACLARPVLRDGDGTGRTRVTAREHPGRLERGEADRLDVDVRVGQALPDRLERRQWLAELLTTRRVVGGHPERLGAHSRLQGSKSGLGAEQRVLQYAGTQ